MAKISEANDLRNAIYEKGRRFMQETGLSFDCMQLTVYINQDFFMKLQCDRDVGQEMFDSRFKTGKRTISGWPVYVVRDNEHPNYKIFVENKNEN